MLAIIVIVNLRGVKESGIVFMLPTILFAGTLLTTIGVGLFRAFATGGHPVAIAGTSAAATCVRDIHEVCADLAAAEGVFQRLRCDDRR